MKQYRIPPHFITTLLMIWKKMLHLLLGFVFLCLQKCILGDSHCGERRHVIGTEGKDVILRVEYNETMGNITWLSAGNHFATTGRDGFIKVRDKRYRGKVYATENGSLNLTGLARDDQGTYTASTLRHATTRTQLCAQYYDLRVYRELTIEDLRIEYTFSYNETCSLAVTCKVEEPDVTLTWSRPTMSDVALTANVLYVYDPDPDVTLTCTAQNPISVAHKSVTPWDYCTQGYNGPDTERIESSRLSATGTTSVSDHTLVNVIRLAVAAGVFAALCCFVAQYGKRSCDRAATQPPTEVHHAPNLDFNETDGIHPTTVYVLAQ